MGRSARYSYAPGYICILSAGHPLHASGVQLKELCGSKKGLAMGYNVLGIRGFGYIQLYQGIR